MAPGGRVKGKDEEGVEWRFWFETETAHSDENQIGTHFQSSCPDRGNLAQTLVTSRMLLFLLGKSLNYFYSLAFRQKPSWDPARGGVQCGLGTVT